jgi:hypothetical protein
MGAMQLTSSLDFDADPARVSAMLTDRAFLERVCAASDAVDHSVEVTGNRTRVSRTLLAPASAATFTGEHVTVVEEVDWDDARPDGTRSGRLSLSIPGLPVAMGGTVDLRAGGRGTTVTYAGDLKVNIPFVGRKLEESAAPAVIAGIDLQQRVGEEWLGQ